MNTFRGKPFPGCIYHERPLVRSKRYRGDDFTTIRGYELICPDCLSAYRKGLAPTIRTPSIPITAWEFEMLPANPTPAWMDPFGEIHFDDEEGEYVK